MANVTFITARRQTLHPVLTVRVKGACSFARTFTEEKRLHLQPMLLLVRIVIICLTVSFEPYTLNTSPGLTGLNAESKI